MMKKIFFAITSLLTLVSLAFSAAPANAYPTGQNLSVSVSSTAIAPNTSVSVRANNAYPGCLVSFTAVNGKSTFSATATAGSTGATPYVPFTLTALGTYKISASYNCNRVKETASANVKVGNQTTTTIATFTVITSGTTTTFSVAGTVKFGALNVSGISGTAVFTLGGVSQGSARLKTLSNGSYTGSYAVRKALPAGTYLATVTFTDMSPYIGSSATKTYVKALAVVGKASVLKSTKLK